VKDEGDFLDRLFGLLNGLRNGTIAVAIIQALAALLLISNTIQLAAFTRRTETSIMRLVGASRWYTQLPFILEAALAGLIGALLAFGGLALAKVYFVDETLAGPIQAGIIPPIDWVNILTVTPIIAVSGIALASVASYVTLRLYVRL
ncbi:MAG: FtsX-like permease family protein, partial [Geodermatophilaceae bacterium]